MTHWTERYIGLPYLKGGDDLGGFNCWGFFRHVEREHFGVRVPLIGAPDRLSKLLRKVPAAAEALGWEKVDAPRGGDAVLMAHWKHPSHVGIWVDDIEPASVLHCVDGAGSVLHSLAHLRIAAWRVIAWYRPIDLGGDAAAAVLEVPGHG
ncbi:MAG: NlpC/P60 family protein [Legionella sp.]|nr:NlpC/P60 family protein [Legionella sp.]